MFSHPFSPLIFLILLPLALSQPRCPPGTVLNGTKCTPCPMGTYSMGGTCASCPKGTYGPIRGAVGLDICVECPEGTFGPKEGATSISDCRPCAPGTNAPEGSPNCISCKAGQGIRQCRPFNFEFEFAFRGICFACDFNPIGAGGCFRSVGNLDPMLECVTCESGTFSENNPAECMSCPEGTTSGQGASKCMPINSLMCPPGTVSSFGECRECTRFRFSDGTFPFCRTCPSGMRADKETGGSRCVPCPEGTAGEFGGECDPCPPGQNTNVRGATFCVPDNTPCAPNFFRDNNGACKTCGFMERYNRVMNKCVKCPNNQISFGGLTTSCKRCPAGMIAPSEVNGITDVRCFCKPGSESVPGSNGTKCQKCRPGFASDGTQKCMRCSQGTFAPRQGMRACINCPRGRVQSPFSSARCVARQPCPRGTVRSTNPGTMDMCIVPQTGCPRGTSRSLNGENAVFCTPTRCPQNQVLIALDFFQTELFCDSCPPGFFYSRGSRQCFMCDDDEFSRGGSSTTCQQCPTPRPAFVEGRIFRPDQCCPTGTVRHPAGDGCIPCPPGTIKDRFSSNCENCPRGQFSDSIASSSCRPCPAGQISFGQGETGCVVPGSLSS